MLSLRDFKPEDLDVLLERFDFNRTLDLACPTMVYVFRDGDEIIGYSKITIPEKVYLTDFKIKDSCPKEYALFFLKATGFKIDRMGFDRFYDKKHLTDSFYDGEEILLDELFKGSCGDVPR